MKPRSHIPPWLGVGARLDVLLDIGHAGPTSLQGTAAMRLLTGLNSSSGEDEPLSPLDSCQRPPAPPNAGGSTKATECISHGGVLAPLFQACAPKAILPVSLLPPPPPALVRCLLGPGASTAHSPEELNAAHGHGPGFCSLSSQPPSLDCELHGVGDCPISWCQSLARCLRCPGTRHKTCVSRGYRNLCVCRKGSLGQPEAAG